MPCQFPGCKIPSPTDWCLRHGIIYGPPRVAKVKQALSIPELTIKAQKLINHFVVLRDKELGCISCGKEVTEAGHYIAVGTNTALRYNLENLNGQCHYCNCFRQGNLKEYRVGLILKIGLKDVLFLENYPRFHKFSRTQLENIINHYSPSKITLNNS